ncbi:rho GTPase-activating protein 28 isoform X2 [Entelurus aequoreus]|uniref:rho GTPase-activating protein 28 isoform X2 n=1 Tax=Entelurus aequoreus TaxID=161455 RepID=UPI002B1D2A52|nr:rho GTPase-activating protein 28 isoform X2 [Entelurus aequoreus]
MLIYMLVSGFSHKSSCWSKYGNKNIPSVWSKLLPLPSFHLLLPSFSTWTIRSQTSRRMLSSLSCSGPPPPDQTATSDSRHITMETYWREVQSIEEEREGDEEEEEERKSMDEVELEEAWLTEAGLSSLVTGLTSEEAPPPAEALLSTLTHQQAATVKARLDNYKHTMRERNRPIRDVRDVFASDSEASPASPSQCTESPPSRFHTTTKTIRRNTTSVRPRLPNCYPPDDTLFPANTPLSSTHTSSPAPGQERHADWLVRDCPYSEGVAEHKRGVAHCWDCLRFQGEDSKDEPFVCPPQGVTLADDLSSGDLKRLGFICHIELSTFLQALGVQTKRNRPTRSRGWDGAVFGVALNTLLENDRRKLPGVKVPVVFQKLLSVLEQNGLQTEGILRVPGSAARLKYLRRELDRCPEGFDWSKVRQVDAAGLLKLFIRELPTPLLTHTHLPTYQAVLGTNTHTCRDTNKLKLTSVCVCVGVGVSSAVHQVQALQMLSLLLPESHKETLRALLVFLSKVVSHQDQNRMSLWNVSMVMAPNLFAHHHRGNKHSLAKQQEDMEKAVGGADLVRLMVVNQDVLWTVPNFLLAQLRQMNKASNHKLGLPRPGRLLRSRNDKNKQQVTELCDGVIKVHAPLHTKVSMAIQLDRQMRARDVTAHFKCDNSGVQRLYEVGGNIGERRLHPDCLLLDVYHVNPRCDWLIKH